MCASYVGGHACRSAVSSSVVPRPTWRASTCTCCARLSLPDVSVEVHVSMSTAVDATVSHTRPDNMGGAPMCFSMACLTLQRSSLHGVRTMSSISWCCGTLLRLYASAAGCRGHAQCSVRRYQALPGRSVQVLLRASLCKEKHRLHACLILYA